MKSQALFMNNGHCTGMPILSEEISSLTSDGNGTYRALIGTPLRQSVLINTKSP